MGGDKLYFQIFQTIFFLTAYWKLGGPGVEGMGGHPPPGLAPCSLAGHALPSQVGAGGRASSGLAVCHQGGDSVTFGFSVVTLVVAPSVHPSVGTVQCSVLRPGLRPSSFVLRVHPAALGFGEGTRTPGTEPPASHPQSCPHPLPCPHPRVQWLSMVNGDACPQRGVPAQPGWPRWPPCPGLGAAQAQTPLGAWSARGWQRGGSGRASSRGGGGGGRCLNTIRFVELGPASRLTSLCTSLATSHGHSADATHSLGHRAPRGVGTPWRSLYIASKRNKKKMKCENNDRFK